LHYRQKKTFCVPGQWQLASAIRGQMTEIGRKIIAATGRIRLLGRNAYIGKMAANIKITFFESLDGLEAWINGQCVAVLRDYRTFKQIAVHWRKGRLPQAFYFEPLYAGCLSANC
jgi:hypothetical protein